MCRNGEVVAACAVCGCPEGEECVNHPVLGLTCEPTGLGTHGTPTPSVTPTPTPSPSCDVSHNTWAEYSNGCVENECPNSVSVSSVGIDSNGGFVPSIISFRWDGSKIYASVLCVNENSNNEATNANCSVSVGTNSKTNKGGTVSPKSILLATMESAYSSGDIVIKGNAESGGGGPNPIVTYELNITMSSIDKDKLYIVYLTSKSGNCSSGEDCFSDSSYSVVNDFSNKDVVINGRTFNKVSDCS